MSGICSNCRLEHDRAGRYCAACHAAYMREWRKGRVYVSSETILNLLRKKRPQAHERTA